MAENLQLSPFDQSFPPIISKRSPTTRDRAELGTIWINTVLNDVFILTSVVAGVSTWINAGGGSGTFSSLNISGASVFGGAITASTFTAGVVLSSATGVLSSSAGTNGQLLIGKTGLVPAWSTLTAGAGIGIVEGVGTITISAPGATAVSYVTDVAGPVLPDGAGAVNVVGGSNLTSDGTVANTITIDLNPSVSVTGKLTAGNDLEMTTGTCLIASDDNAANAIYLHANGGVNETINIFSDQGSGVDSIWMHSDVGGLTITSGLASADAINIGATDAAGGIDVDYGTAGINFAGANGAFTVTSGTGAISIGADAAVHDVTLGGTTGASSLLLQAGTGAVTVTAGGMFDLNAVGLVTVDSTGGRIDIGAQPHANHINIGTGAAARTVTIGNSTGASSVIVDCGTGALDLGVTATDHTSRLGSTTGVSALTLQAGTGAMTFTAGGAFDVNAVGAVTIDSTGAAIDIGAGANAFGINIGTGAAARAIIIGNATTTTSVAVNTGTGDFTVTSQDAVIVDAVGVVELNSSGAAISIGNDANAFGINIGTGAAARTIEIGNNTGATAINLSAGSGEVNSDTDINLTTAGTGFVLQEGPKILAGAGSPNGSLVAPKGSLFLATNGSGVGDRAYINTDGNTAWTAITTAS